MHYNEADGRSSCIVGGGCATRRRQRAGNHGISCSRGMPRVTRAVVRVFQGLGCTKTFDGAGESVEQKVRKSCISWVVLDP